MLLFACLYGLVCAEPINLGSLKKDWLGYPIKESIKTNCKVPGLIDESPEEICQAIDFLKEVANNPAAIEASRAQLLLFYGPPGNGKTTIAEKIASESNGIFISVHVPTLVTKYAGEGAQKIETIFNEALEKSIKNGQPVIILFDHIDLIANSNYGEMRIEHNLAASKLRLCLDKIKNNPNVCFIGITNNIEIIPFNIKSCFGKNIIEIKNPNLEARKKALIHFLKVHNYKADDAILKNLASESEGLSVRDFELIIHDLVERAKKNKLTLTANMIYIELVKKKKIK